MISNTWIFILKCGMSFYKFRESFMELRINSESHNYIQKGDFYPEFLISKYLIIYGTYMLRLYILNFTWQQDSRALVRGNVVRLCQNFGSVVRKLLLVVC